MNSYKYISWYSGIRLHLKSEVIDYNDFVFDMMGGSISNE